MAQTKVPQSQIDSTNRCSLYRTTDLPITPGWNSIPFDNEDYDTNTMHDNVTNNTRITIKESGYYAFGAVARFATPGVAGLKIVRYNISNTNIRGGVMAFSTSGGSVSNVYKEFYLNAGDYLIAQVYTDINNNISHSTTGEVEPACSFWAAMRSK